MTDHKKVILITGCARGVGFETAKALVLQGEVVYAGVRNLANATSLIEFSKSHENLKVLQLDITKEKEASHAVRTILKNEKRIDVLIYCAAHVLFGPVEMVSIKQAKHQFEITFFGILRMIQKVLPSMRKRKSGHIICLGSTSGVKSEPMYSM